MIVFGAKDKPDKGIIVMVTESGEKVVTICELENSGYDYGDTQFPLTDIRYIYTSLRFLRKESLENAINILQVALDDWEKNG